MVYRDSFNIKFDNLTFCVAQPKLSFCASCSSQWFLDRRVSDSEVNDQLYIEIIWMSYGSKYDNSVAKLCAKKCRAQNTETKNSISNWNSKRTFDKTLT